MKKWLSLVLCACSFIAYCQPGNPFFGLTGHTTFDVDMRPIALMDLETTGVSTNFDITLGSIDEAGTPLGTNPLYSNAENWINYSCANRDVSTRHIEIQVTSGSVPQGFELRLDVDAPIGGGGTLGQQSLSTIVLSATSQTIISSIGGAYTENGNSNGHRLNFTLHYLSGSYGSIFNQNSDPIIITYTIVDD